MYFVNYTTTGNMRTTNCVVKFKYSEALDLLSTGSGYITKRLDSGEVIMKKMSDDFKPSAMEKMAIDALIK